MQRLMRRRRHDRRATAATRRLATDRRLRDAFRDDPHEALRRWRLSDDQVAAICAGDGASLAAAGVDVAAVDTPPLWFRVRNRALLLLAGVLAVLGGPAVGTASADRARARRFGRSYISGRAIRIGRRVTGKGGIRYARRFSDGVRLRVRLVLTPQGCPDAKQCGVFEIVD